MPFSRKLAFVKHVLKGVIKDGDHVFYCEPTDEAFIHYEDFCERVIQCNSLIWTDTVSGISELTYLEALESEEKSTTSLKSLPDELHAPVLYLASIAESLTFEALLNDVFLFVKDRFFKGEVVTYITLHDEIWREGIVSRIIAPSEEEVDEFRSSVELLDGGEFFPPPSLYLYEVETTLKGKRTKSIVSIPLLKRPPGMWTRGKARVFLEHFATNGEEDKWTIERGVLEKFNIPNARFEDFYDGPTPIFPVSKIMQDSVLSRESSLSPVKKLLSPGKKLLSPGKKLLSPCKKLSSPGKKPGGFSKKSENSVKKRNRTHKNNSRKMKTSNTNEIGNNKTKLQQTDIKNYFISSQTKTVSKEKHYSGVSSDEDCRVEVVRSPKHISHTSPSRTVTQTQLKRDNHSDVSCAPSCSGLSPKMKSDGGSAMFKKRKQMRITGDGRLEVNRSKKFIKSEARRDSDTRQDLKIKKTRDEEEIRRNKREKEVLEGFKLHEERLKMKAKHEEEKLQFAKFMKEWRKKREDLECEDLKPLPVPNQINCHIPNYLFGEFVMVLEFFHSFRGFLKVKSYIPGGITFEILERALIETEIAGPLIDILYALLNTIFELQVAENETPKTGIPISVDLNLEDLYNRKMTFQEAIPLCIAASGWCDTFQGVSLNEIDLNPMSVSEILRLHLLGSGGRAWDTNSKWLSQRGGHTNFDDPGLWLRVEQTSVLLSLSHKHVCQMSVEEKLIILSCLMNQILTYARVRDILDERGDRSKQAKSDVRAVEIAELKLQKEATSRRIQNKREAKLLRLKGESLNKPNPQLLQHEKDTEMEKLKMEKDITKLRLDIQKKHSKVLPLIMNHQLHPIGCDRAHRNFWMFSSIPGLFVEYNPFELGPCLPQPTPVRTDDRGDVESHVRKLFEQGQSCSSDKENDISDGEITKPMSTPNKKMLSEQNVPLEQSNCAIDEKELVSKELEERDVQHEFLTCTANNKCPVHCQPISKSHWSFFSNPEDLLVLLDSLNERGIRESELRRFIVREQERIKESISSCPLHKLNTKKFVEQEPRKSSRYSMNYKTEVVNLNYPPDTPVDKILESLLRDSILQMENKVTLGSLGVLKVNDRIEWRTAIEKGGYDKQCEKLTWGFRRHSSAEKDSKRKVHENQDSDIDDSQEEKKELGFPKREGSSEKSSERAENDQDDDDNGEREDSENSEEEVDAKQFLKKDIHKWGGTDSDTYTSAKYFNKQDRAHPSKDNEENCEIRIESSSLETSTFEYDSSESVNNSNQNTGSEVIKCNSIKKGVNVNTASFPERGDGYSLDDSVNDKEHDEIELEERDNKQPPPRDLTIRDLACAILQLGQSVDPKFLLQPLADKGKSRKQMKYWEVSLMNTINFSQLFIHQLTLDSCINWAKSILRVPCRICRRRGSPECMINCIECNKRFHYICTKPKTPELPQGDWYCPYCTKESDPRPSKHERPSKRKRKSDVEKSGCNEVLQNHSPERKTQKMECNKCGESDDTLVNCCSCTAAFHAECLSPPLRASRRQKENWLCYSCKPPRDLSSLDAASDCDAALEDSDGTTGRERRVCTSATIAKIASFAKRLRSCSWDDEGESSSHYSENSQDYRSSRENSQDYSSSRENLRDYSSSRENSPHRNILREHSPMRRSSRRTDCISEYLPLDNAVLQHLLDEMIHHKDSWPFLRPVRKSEVPDYHLYIKKPMDLGTIKYKLNTAEYKNNYDFVADTLLVFENCSMYNSSQTAVYKCGTQMLQFFKKRCKELGLVVNWNGT